MSNDNKNFDNIENRINNILKEDNYKDLDKEFEDTIESVISLIRSGISQGITQVGNAFNKPEKNRGPIKPVDNNRYVDKKLMKRMSSTWLYNVIGVIAGISFLGIASDGDGLFMAIVMGLISFFSLRTGILNKRRFTRLNRYLRELGSGTVITVRDLASAVGRSEKTVIGDINYYIKKDVLKEARLVDDNRIFLLDKATYEMYKGYDKSLVYENKKELSESTEAISKDKYVKGLNDLPKHVEALNREKIGLPVEIEAKVDKIINIVQVIADYGKDHKEIIPDLSKFSSYYLPATIELIRRYKQFMPVNTEDSLKSREEISKTFDTIEYGFNSLIENIQKDLVMDTKADITVLKHMLKQDGLVKERNELWKEK